MYDKAFFDWFVPHRHLYAPVAEWLKKRLSPKSVLDLGCGNGFFLDLIDSPDSVGVDFVSEAQDAMPERLRGSFVRADLTLPLDLGRRFDLVICTEVAEHLPPGAAEILVETIRRHSAKAILFSAATPGQGGEGHLNERPHEYWRELLEGIDEFILLPDSTASLQQVAPEALSWIKNNALLFWSVR